MPRILVVYGTTEGQTAKIARVVGETLRSHDMAVDVIEASPAAPSPDTYDAVVVAAPVHAGSYKKAVRRWTERHAASLNTRMTAFVTVCLSVLQHDPKVQAEGAAIANRFFTATGWTPTTVTTFAGALLYTRYDPFTRWMMKRIVSKGGGDTDTSRDYEYTDWNAVRTFAEELVKQVRLRAVA